MPLSMSLSVPLRVGVILLALCEITGSRVALGQGTTIGATSDDPKAEFAKWFKRRTELEEEAGVLEESFKKLKPTDIEARQKIIETFQKLKSELDESVQPNIIRLAPLALKADPSNLNAADLVMQLNTGKGKYGENIDIYQRFAKEKKANPTMTLLAGLAQFANHDFETSQTLLTDASKTASKQLFERFGLPKLQACPEYIEFWKQEQALRKAEEKAGDLPRVLFKTTQGEIELELFENEAPNTVANFISLVEAKKYDGTKFHRVIPMFMAQGGDPNSLDTDPSNDGTGGPGYTIACECYAEKARKHFTGSISMAHAGKDTGGSQFFLTHLPTSHLNANAAEMRGHTVFGRIVRGLDLLFQIEKGDAIVKATVLRKRPHEYKPKTMAE